MLSKFSKVSKAVGSFTGAFMALSAFMTFLATNEDIAKVLPPNWIAQFVAIAGALSTLAGLITYWFPKNAPTGKEVDALEAIGHVDDLINEFREKVPEPAKPIVDIAVDTGVAVTAQVLNQVDELIEQFRTRG